MKASILSPLFILSSLLSPAWGDEVLIRERVHLRSGGELEWDEFATDPMPGKTLEHTFKSTGNRTKMCLVIRQYDVKTAWAVELNGKRLGVLRRNENDLITVLDVPVGLIKTDNRLKVFATSKNGSDDVLIGPIRFLDQSREDYLSQASLQISVTDETREALPSRITLINEHGALPAIGTSSTKTMAIRPGTIYLSPGSGKVTVPAGKYTIYAGRGFEYSLAKTQVHLRTGDSVRVKLQVRREVDTRGWVACDTHVHSLTHSGHGDATVDERMLTLAGEGIELPVATDHNVHVDHDPFARNMNVRRFFTPVIGNEVTTKTGHFNIFPVTGKPKPPAHQSLKWEETLKGIYATPKVRVTILNHARDVHSGVRPFGPQLFNEVSGQLYNGRGRHLRRLTEQVVDTKQGRVNAMEILNSSATQTDVMELTRDWMSLLNGGYQITPVGSSDSHDVARHFVGQGRTYIRCDDRDPSDISVNDAVRSFAAGRVSVSYGLMTTIQVKDGRAGDVVSLESDTVVKVRVRVLGPHWTQGSKVTLFQNGLPIRDESLRSLTRGAGIHWQGTFTIPKPKHDAFLVAVALGPGVEQPYWRMAKPYQPTSTKWRSHALGVSGALWLDADNDGRRTSARGYAREIMAASKGKLAPAIDRLKDYDDAVAAQVADLFESSNDTLFNGVNQDILSRSEKRTQAVFRRYQSAVRASLKR